MADLFARPDASASSPVREPLYGAAADQVRDQLHAPSDLDVAISVAQQLLDSDQVLSLREALRLLLRALDAEPGGATTTKPTPLAEARDLRALLETVVDALTLPHDLADYDARVLRRASLAKVIAGEALKEKPKRLGWNVDYLRGKLAAEQAGTLDTKRGQS